MTNSRPLTAEMLYATIDKISAAPRQEPVVYLPPGVTLQDLVDELSAAAPSTTEAP